MNEFIKVVFAAIISIGAGSIGYLIMQIVIQIKRQKDIMPSPLAQASPRVNTYAEGMTDIFSAPPSPSYYESNTEPITEDMGNVLSFARLCFLTEGGKNSGRVEFISQMQTTLGRSRKNDISVADTKISKEHLTIIYEQGNISIIDHHTTNGTYIEGRKVQPEEKTVVPDTEKVYIGNTSFFIEKCS